jgi:hypothetical protein
MAVSILGSSANNGANSATTLTVTHTLSAGSNRLVLAAFAWDSHVSDTISSVTYGGNAMTEVTGSPYTGGALGVALSLWAIKEASLPADGSRDLVVTWGSTIQAYGGVIAFADAHQTTTFTSVATGTATSDTPSVTVSGVGADDFVFVKTANQFGTLQTEGADQTTQWSSSAFNQRGLASTQDGVSGGVMSCLLNTGAGEWMSMGVGILAAGAGAASAKSLALVGVG